MNRLFQAYEVYANADLSEGRGQEVLLSRHNALDEAIMSAKGKDAQGSDGDVYLVVTYLDESNVPKVVEKKTLIWGTRWNWEKMQYDYGYQRTED